MSVQNDTTLFTKRLAETVAWCTSHADADNPKSSLRTLALRPVNLIGQDDWDYQWPTAGESANAVTLLSEKRANLLGTASLPLDLSHGRILISEPNDSVVDGLSEHHSSGFFDESDVPPWDTWVWLLETPPTEERPYQRWCLISWVPWAFVELVNQGIWANCVTCIGWAAAQPKVQPFVERLQEEGLLV